VNDLYYIFYEPRLMFLDTSDMSCAGERAHRRAMDYTWFNDGPPLNQKRILLQITGTSEAEWPEVKRELMRKGWIEAGEYFLHRGAIKSLNESKVKYVENFNRQAKMNKKDILGLSAPDTVTGIVTIVVTCPATDRVTVKQSESEPQPESDKALYSTLKGKGERGEGARAEGGRQKAENGTGGRRVEDGSLTSDIRPLAAGLLTFASVGRMAGEIMGNDWGWFYDNCKVKLTDFTLASLQTVLRPFVGRASERQVRACWMEAVKIAHQMCVDFGTGGQRTEARGQNRPGFEAVKSAAGLATQKFRELLEAELLTADGKR
jgi:hypothetical protein